MSAAVVASPGLDWLGAFGRVVAGAAGLGRLGSARSVLARLGSRRSVRCGIARQGQAGKARLVSSWQCTAWQARFGQARHDQARLGIAGRGSAVGFRLGTAGRVGHVGSGFGLVWHGSARQARLVAASPVSVRPGLAGAA